MKHLSKYYKSISLIVLSLLFTAIAFAEDEVPELDINISTDTNDGAFYTQVWFWVVIGLVFILLLVALLRGGGSKKE